jgi:iron-sulfur cluster repair protein YtfE (RIC family)
MQYKLQICNRLHEDHMATIQLLERLEETLSRIGLKSPPDASEPKLASLLADLSAAMQNEISSHFGFEEEHLFSRIQALGDTPMLSILQDEHDIIRPLALQVTEAEENARNSGFTAESWAAFYDLGLELVERETFHIQKEEMGFLPLLDQIVDAAEDEPLAKAYGEK